MIILHNICQILINRPKKKTFGFCDGSENFNKNSSPSPVKFWFYTDKIVSAEWRDLVPRQRTGDSSEIHFCALQFQCHQSLLFVEQISFGICRSEYEHWASIFLYLHFCSVTFRIGVRSFRGMCEHTCAGPRDSLCRAVSNQDYLALDPPCTSHLKNVSHAGSRFPVACWSRSVSIGFPHACLSLRVGTGSDNPNFLE